MKRRLAIRSSLAVLTVLALACHPLPPDRHSGDAAADCAELADLFQSDQADRRPPGGKAIDWAIVSASDREREARVRALYAAGTLQTGRDYFRAALVLQHGPNADSHLLAHEFSIVAIAKGELAARWLAAAAEDRFLMDLGRPQRFGTQYHSDGPGAPMHLYDVDPAVTDELRRALNVPSIEEARRREAAMNPK